MTANHGLDSKNVSADFKRLNPQLFGVGGVSKPKPQPRPECSDARKDGDEARSKGSLESGARPIVTIIGMRMRITDDDNFRGGLKHLRDAIAEDLGLDDAERFICWNYQQVKVNHRNEEGTLLRIAI